MTLECDAWRGLLAIIRFRLFFLEDDASTFFLRYVFGPETLKRALLIVRLVATTGALSWLVVGRGSIGECKVRQGWGMRA